MPMNGERCHRLYRILMVVVIVMPCLFALGIVPARADEVDYDEVVWSADTVEVFGMADNDSLVAEVLNTTTNASEESLSTQSTEVNLAEGTWGSCAWEIDRAGTLAVHAGEGETGYSGNDAPWRDMRTRIKKVVFEDGVVLPRKSDYMFASCNRLISADMSGCDTLGVVDIGEMFANCSRLTSLNLTGWDVSNVKNMDGMFAGCSSLTSLDLSGWDVTAVENMDVMFTGCTSIASLDVSGWKIGNVVPQFRGMSGLRNIIGLSDWDIFRITDLSSMFEGCSRLVSIDISDWDTSGVTSFYGMFDGCASLASLDLSSWDTSNAEYMGYMFCGCSSLRALDLSSWQMAYVRDTSGMFQDCCSLERLNLFGWNLTSAGSDMYLNCKKLSWIKLGSGYRVSSFEDYFPKATSTNGMWWSHASHKWLTSSQIVKHRLGVPDTYTSTVEKGHETDINELIAQVDSPTYKGRALKPKLYLEDENLGNYGYTLVKGVDYSLTYSNNVNAGKGIIKLTGIGNYKGSRTVRFKIRKAKNTLSAKGKSVSTRASKLSGKAQNIKPSKAYVIKDAIGKVSYKLKSVNKNAYKDYFKTTRSGKITVKRGLPNGTYKLKVAVTAAGNKNYKVATKTITVKVVVK